MGTSGFKAVMTRALARASNKKPALRGIKVNVAGDLEPVLDSPSGKIKHTEDCDVVLITELLSLLLSFIGTNLTLQLIREVWPQLAIYESNF
jgi:hypothetical protein